MLPPAVVQLQMKEDPTKRQQPQTEHFSKITYKFIYFIFYLNPFVINITMYYIHFILAINIIIFYIAFSLLLKNTKKILLNSIFCLFFVILIATHKASVSSLGTRGILIILLDIFLTNSICFV